MLRWQDLLHEVTFTHMDQEGNARSIAAGRLNDHLDKDYPVNVERVRIPVEPGIVSRFLEHNGIEAHRLDRITARDLRAYPITMLHWTGGTHLLVDGHHRYIAAFLMKHTHIRARMVPEEVWAPFEVEIKSMPGFSLAALEDYQRTGFSGIV